MPQQNPQDQTSKNLVPRNLNPLPPKSPEREPAGTAHIRFIGPKTGRPGERADVPFDTAARAGFGGLTIAAVLAQASIIGIEQPQHQVADTENVVVNRVQRPTEDANCIEGEVVRRDDD